ncbi:hypothetical protein HDU67_006066 [Dinochytrium kinnereticum]|nr:hypothetical protein HDU67_006066 [Dinochytrium kinnereticum]
MSILNKVFLIIGAAGCAAGLAGTIAHAVLSNIETPILHNQFIGLWFALSTVVTSAELIHLDRYLDTYAVHKMSLNGNLIYFGIMTVSSLICFICYCLVPDGAAGVAWNLVLLAIAGCCLYLLVFRASPQIHNNQEDKPTPGISSTSVKVGNCLNVTLKSFHSFFSLLLLGGACLAAFSYTAFKHRGNLVTVSMKDGRTFTMHIYCIGTPSNATNPTIWITSSAAHGVVDFYGIQQRLVDSGRRVCTHDNPGFGWSSSVLANQQDYTEFYDSMLKESGEPDRPIVFVGWGAGGTPLTKYASINPSKVAALVFVTVFPPGIEFTDHQNMTGMSDSELDSYKRIQLTGRQALANIVLALGIPWPLMPIFTPPNSVAKGYEPQDRAEEFRVQIWKSKMWVGQLWGIKKLGSQDDTKDPLNTIKLPSSIPLTHIMCNLSDEQACSKDQSVGLPGDCKEWQRRKNFYQNRQLEMTKAIQSSARFLFNNDTDCKLDMPVNKPLFTAQSILAAIANA